jgi:2-polyprenyl-3-methyl-5-hydroxy-6-metoxy-1,4-benzoquinol methylase
MPSSQHYHISKIMDLIISVKPFSVLDVGCGFGKYGVLCREYLELWDGRQEYEFVRRIDGVEVFENYITPLHKFIYNNMYIENIINVISKLDYSYDLVLLIDVLEHFSKGEGMLLLNNLLKKNKGILVSTPKKPSPQKDVFGNAFEIHKSLWKKKELSTLGKNYFIRDNVSHIVYITREQNDLNNLISSLKILKRSRHTSLVKNLISTKNSIVKNLKKKLSTIPFIVKVYRKFKRN